MNGGVHFLHFQQEIPLWGKFGPKNQNYQFKVKFGAETNSNMVNSMVIFTFLFSTQNSLFWENLIQKIKNVSFNWNLVPWLIRRCTIQWNCSMFLFPTGNTLFFGRFDSKSQNCYSKLKFCTLHPGHNILELVNNLVLIQITKSETILDI